MLQVAGLVTRKWLWVLVASGFFGVALIFRVCAGIAHKVEKHYMDKLRFGKWKKKKMSREEGLDELLQMLITKKSFAIFLDEMTEEIDTKAKQVELTSHERTKLILKVNEIMNNKKS